MKWFSDPDLVARVTRLLDEGEGYRAAQAFLDARGYDVPEASLRRQMREVRARGGDEAPAPPEGVPTRAHVPARDGIKRTRDDAYFDHLEQAATLYLEQNAPGGFYTLDVPQDGPRALAFTSDWHVGAKAVDYHLLKQHIQLLADADGVDVILAGDMINNPKRGRKSGNALYRTMCEPAEQWQWFEKLIRPLAHKIRGIVTGNHDAWDFDEAGMETLLEWCYQHQIPYWGHGGVVKLRVGDQCYYGVVRHEYPGASNINPSNNQRKVYDQFPRPAEAAHLDFVYLGHLHHNQHDEAGRATGECHYLRGGAYLIYSEFADQKHGAWKTTPGVPVVIFDDAQHDALSFKGTRLDLALRVLDWERGAQTLQKL